RMDVYDDPDSPTIVATFELPGVVKRDDVSISVKDGALIVQGQRLLLCATDMDVDSDANARFFPFQELRYGSFARRLQLPLGANTRHTTASLSDGLLTVSWPRSP
ncbi:HSP20-like chaperone, partial [Mycena rebaudengoi]